MGDETHCMLKCKNEIIVNIKRTLFTNMQNISPQVLKLNDDDKLIYLLKGHDASLRNVVLHWCKNCNELFRK